MVRRMGAPILSSDSNRRFSVEVHGPLSEPGTVNSSAATVAGKPSGMSIGSVTKMTTATTTTTSTTTTTAANGSLGVASYTAGASPGTAPLAGSGGVAGSGQYYISNTAFPLYLSAAPPQHSTLSSCSSLENRARIELQRQSLKDRRKRTDDLTVKDRIPGYSTSAAFLGSLRTNLRLNVSPPPSPLGTPPSMRSSLNSLPPPSPLATPVDSVMDDPGIGLIESTSNTADRTSSRQAATPAVSIHTQDSLSNIPELKSYLAAEEDDKKAALKLIADSVAQMRQTANRSLISSPVNLAATAAILGLFLKYLLSTRAANDITVLSTASVSVVIALLILYRFLTQGYLKMAEEINWNWLDGGDSTGGEVLVTKFGDEIIGALVIEWVSGESSRSRRKKAWIGEIRAWTVRMRYRGKGVGTALLEDAVGLARKKGAEKIEFADDHANSARILPSLYNKSFDERDKRARQALEDLWQSSPVRGRKK